MHGVFRENAFRLCTLLLRHLKPEGDNSGGDRRRTRFVIQGRLNTGSLQQRLEKASFTRVAVSANRFHQ